MAARSAAAQIARGLTGHRAVAGPSKCRGAYRGSRSADCYRRITVPTVYCTLHAPSALPRWSRSIWMIVIIIDDGRDGE